MQTESKSSFWILTQRVFFFSTFPFFSLCNFYFLVASLDKLHAKHVLPGFSDRSHEEREIEALTTDITKVRPRPLSLTYLISLFPNQDFRHCQSLINKISAPQSHAFPPDHKKSRHEDLTAKNVQRGLAAKVQDLSAAFRKKQRVYMESWSSSPLSLHHPHLLLPTPFPSSARQFKIILYRYVPRIQPRHIFIFFFASRNSRSCDQESRSSFSFGRHLSQRFRWNERGR